MWKQSKMAVVSVALSALFVKWWTLLNIVHILRMQGWEIPPRSLKIIQISQDAKLFTSVFLVWKQYSEVDFTRQLVKLKELSRNVIYFFYNVSICFVYFYSCPPIQVKTEPNEDSGMFKILSSFAKNDESVSVQKVLLRNDRKIQ